MNILQHYRHIAEVFRERGSAEASRSNLEEVNGAVCGV